MKLVDEFRSPERVRGLVERILALPGEWRFMEVCGTHTMAIARFGLKELLAPKVRFLSGPGCPVCVTSAHDIDTLLAIAREPGVIIATFGDMLRVTGSRSSLEKERALGAEVKMVYSPLDALELAKAGPGKRVVMAGVGFETTTPTVAGTVMMAAHQGVRNFFVLSTHKTIPPAMEALLSLGEVRLDGFLCPGHVSVIIGTAPYLPVAEGFGVPCVVSGFEPVDILQGVLKLVELAAAGRAEVAVEYSRAVSEAGNPRAREMMLEVFEPVDAEWRGFGVIPASGLRLREKYASFDALRVFDPEVEPAVEFPGCSCGAILRGIAEPADCPLFGKACTPAAPVGPCMVSSEGSCAAAYRYGTRDD
ncbi:MAG: hydrogenase formation protein HypD [Candidatus Geothermincolia bacterium]